MKLQRNDTTYPEIVELSAWEWAACARGLSDGPIDSAGLSQRHGGLRPCQHTGPYTQRKRARRAFAAALEQPEIGSR